MDSIIDNFLDTKGYDETSDLCRIMTNHGSDKGTKHNYTSLYTILFAKFKTVPINILEIGIGTTKDCYPNNMGPNGIPGASLRGWKEYFTLSHIYGCDIDNTILFEEDRISTFFADQTKSDTILSMWDTPELKYIKFDIIIDDGFHDFCANDIFISNAHHKLNEGGIYIVEDVQKQFFPDFEKNMSKYLQWFSYARLVSIPWAGTNDFENNGDNSVLVLCK
jgi:hypothetical protein